MALFSKNRKLDYNEKYRNRICLRFELHGLVVILPYRKSACKDFLTQKSVSTLILKADKLMPAYCRLSCLSFELFPEAAIPYV